jgi:hypothetical protein
MNDSRAGLKTELMTEAEVLIDELVAWTADTPAPTSTQIEDIQEGWKELKVGEVH